MLYVSSASNASASHPTVFFTATDSANDQPVLRVTQAGTAVAIESNGNIDLAQNGNKILITEGTNASMGTAVLVAGTVTVSNTLVTANSRIFLTINTAGGTPGAVYISARTAGTDFTITSTSGTDTSTVAWLIIEPS